MKKTVATLVATAALVAVPSAAHAGKKDDAPNRPDCISNSEWANKVDLKMRRPQITEALGHPGVLREDYSNAKQVTVEYDYCNRPHDKARVVLLFKRDTMRLFDAYIMVVNAGTLVD